MAPPLDSLFPVILCGGSGTRLWPLSRTLLPKQFLPLAGTQSMFQQTALRLAALTGARAPVVVSHTEHRFLAREQLREVDLEPTAHLLETMSSGIRQPSPMRCSAHARSRRAASW
jgi:mannose-1-phosphate guanylyltransferase